MKKYFYFVPAVVIVLIIGSFFLANLTSPDSSKIEQLTKPEVAGAPSSHQAVMLKYRLRDRQELSFSFDYRISGEIDLSSLVQQDMSPELQSITHNAKGNIYFQFHEVAPNNWRVLGVIELVSLVQNETVIGSELKQPLHFAFQMSSLGVMSDFDYDSELTQSVASTLLQQFQLILPPVAKTQWKTKERDAIGRYYSEYRLVDNHIIKRKTHYYDYHEQTLDMAWQGADVTTKVNQAAIKVAIDKSHGWIETIEVNEQLETYIEGGKSDAVLLVMNAKAIQPPSSVQFLEPKGIAPPVESADLGIQKYYQTVPELNAMGAGLSALDALAVFNDLLAEGNSEGLALQFIVNYLRQNPKATFELVDSLDNGEGISHGASLRLWYAIAETGHREAQLALARVVLEQGYRPLAKNRALSVVHDIEYPTEELVSDMFSAATMSVRTEKEQMLKNMAMLALGTLGDPEKLNQEQTERVEVLLRNELHSSSNPDNTVILLAAVGNAANPKLVDVAVSMTHNENTNVRSESLLALMQIPSSESRDAFYDAMDKEADPTVRARVLEHLSSRDASDMQDWAINQLSEEMDEGSRVQYIHYLGRIQKSSDKAATALRHFLSSENITFQEKRAIYSYISP